MTAPNYGSPGLLPEASVSGAGSPVCDASDAAEPGNSVAVNGCCLTLTAVADGTLEFDAVPETLARTTLGGLGEGADVNLEPALRACVT